MIIQFAQNLRLSSVFFKLMAPNLYMYMSHRIYFMIHIIEIKDKDQFKPRKHGIEITSKPAGDLVTHQLQKKFISPVVALLRKIFI